MPRSNRRFCKTASGQSKYNTPARFALSPTNLFHPDFNNAIGFADWVDVQDTNGKWWIGQIIGEKTEGGVKHLQVKYTANAKPPELIVADTSGIDKNDTSNGENVSENDDETKTGQENSNEQQQEEVHAPNNLVR